jgi:ankyrin repeat protein
MACIHGHSSVIRVLLQFGADVFLENAHNELVCLILCIRFVLTPHRAPFDMAWSTILCFENTPNAAHFNVAETRSLFPSIPFLADHRRFTILHQIVTQMISSDLRLASKFSPSTINAVDIHGRTPLHWAVARGDANSASILLNQGADPNFADMIGQGPLRSSLKAANPACTKLLISAGANIEARDKWGQSPLLATVYTTDPIAFGLALLEAGADIDAQDEAGSTILLWAVRHNNLEYVRILVNCGADVSLGDNKGICPLEEAIKGNHTGILEAITSAATFTAVFPPISPHTMVHIAAGHAEEDVLNILERVCINTKVNTQIRDKQGRTAKEIAESRFSNFRFSEEVDLEKGTGTSRWMTTFDRILSTLDAG